MRQKMSAVMRIPILDWPPDLFATKDGAADGRLCACGCGKRHNNTVSRVVKGRSGEKILWYRTMSCRNKHKGVSSLAMGEASLSSAEISSDG
jgi:hypothetical protein